MTETRGERRAETAKQSDDSDIIDAAIEESAAESAAPGQQGSGGGNLQRDVATQAERDQVEDPETHESVKKGDHMAHGQHSDEPHPATKVVTER